MGEAHLLAVDWLGWICYLFDKWEFEYYDFMSDYRSPWVFNKILQKP